jgi:hypothetical protein
MKFPVRLLVSILTILVLVIQIKPVHASPATQEVTSNPAAEEYVKSELLNTGIAVLGPKFRDPKDRGLSGAFIVGLFKDPDLQTKPFIKIYNATIVGDINADGISIPFNVEFHDCVFYGRISLDSAEVKTFRIDDSTVKGSVRLGRLVAKGDVALYRSTFESEVTLFGANIGNNLFARGSKFLGVIPDSTSKYPFELWKTQVGQSTEFTNTVIKGEVGADDAKFGVDVKFDGAIFDKPATFMNIQVGNLADFQGARFKDTVTFESSIMERDAKFTGAIFDGDANFDYVSVARFFDFNQTKLNKGFSFQYSTVGWPYFESTTFNGVVNFEGVQASNDFDFTNAIYKYLAEPFTVKFAKVDGAVKFEGFTAPAGLSLGHNQFGDLSISGAEGVVFAFIDLNSTEVNGDLKIENIVASKLSAEGVVVKNITIFNTITVGDELDMSNASLGFLTIDEKGFWPRNQNSKNNLRGMTYTDIGLVNNELEDNTWGVLLDMVQQSDYSPQAYRTLAQFLTEKGHPDWAAEVEFQRKLRERDHILTPRSGPWFWSWFLDIFSGYGQRPQYAFGWSFLVIIIGTLVFRRESDMVIIDNSEAKPPYNAVLYSFALFLPYIDLDIASKWEPKPSRKFAGLYKHIHRLLGWILMPIALLTFGGIIK